jgi:hypothetical protein
MKLFDKIMTAMIVGLALSAAYVASASIQELNNINNAPGRGVASTKFIAQKS